MINMNILFIHGSHSEGGGDTVYINLLLSQLRNRGINAHLISIEKNDSIYSLKASKSGGSTEFIEVKTLSKVNTFIGDYCDTFEIGLIHIHTIHWTSITRHCLKLRPVIKTPHATDLVCPGSYKFFSNEESICTIPFGKHCLIHAYTKRCCSRSPAKLLGAYYNVWSETREFAEKYKSIVVMSGFVKQECINAGIDPDKVSVIPYFTMPVPDKEVQKGKIKLLYVGRLSQVKGVHFLIESIAPLLRSKEDIQLDIIGDGPYATILKTLATDKNINDKLVFHGWKGRDFIDNAMEECEMLIFPSIYPEAFGISGIEAMMHGKPVIAFNVGGVSTWLKDNETGFLIERCDIVKMRDRIQFLLDNSEIREKMGRRAREIAMSEFAPEVHIDRLLKVYSDCYESRFSN
jgi:glycosyltransferase involved in cell wall biosynthesis